MSAKIIIGADLVPTKNNFEYFKSGNVEKLIGKELIEKLNQADFKIFNLEVPLTNRETPICKCGPNLWAPTDTIVGLQAINPCFFTLANNHILDQGEQGLFSTMQVLDNANIKYAGAGKNIEEALQPYNIDINGIKVGIYCCAEHEFSIATSTRPGANPFDPLESLDHIVSLKEKCDYVICLYHGGKEHYRYPSPELQKTCRKIIEKGADLVVCQHSHCIGCEEKWLNGCIVYGQGNFLFDDSDSRFWQTSVLIEIDLLERGIKYIPLQKTGSCVKLAGNDEGKKIISEMQTRSKQIQKTEFVEEEYSRLAKSMLFDYISRDDIMLNSLIFKIFNKISGHQLGKKLIQKKLKRYSMCYINQYHCEAHRELILKGLEELER